ncbi:hypothetical protein CYMTET_12955 [Cymbomonas tetramitiformis]|uniref:Acyl-CoA dehydrogenase n=1 Tax=Cymbomonas tetramitiformis TaxID=36881 RepID=A0AAE0GJJ1_9CHLO|nr:hypothetical protein CYMTET_12955 [Cymbomonas tetramitiformis]
MSGLEAMAPAQFEALKAKLWTFMHDSIYPNEQLFIQQTHAIGQASNEWTHAPIHVELMRKAKTLHLWNMFLPVDSAAMAGVSGGGLTNLQYAEICEILGTSCPAEFASQCTNCTSPDTGNMEVLARYGTPAQREQWLIPLLNGTIRSAYAMTEPGNENQKGSSDATNMSIRVERDEKTQEYVINGSKWWITGAGSLHCKVMILMGKTNPEAAIHKTTSQILVPMDTPGITLLRPLCAFGDDDAPKGHMEIVFEDCRVPFENVILGEGRGFEISQGRLGPGRIHHCMRAIGQAERALAAMCSRVQNRTVFGKKLSKFDSILQDIGKIRAEIECCRLLIHKAADNMDKFGNKDPRTRQLLSLVKAHVPVTLQDCTDRCMQAHGAKGFSNDTPLFSAWAGARALRMADGPDEVHWRTAAGIELKLQEHSPLKNYGEFEVDRTKVFRRTTDPISETTKQLLKNYSKL